MLYYPLIFLISYIGTFIFYITKFFEVHDVPNHRSMHVIPTKKSAGIIFISVFILSVLFGQWSGLFNLAQINILIVGLAFCMILGLIDDRFDVSSGKKMFLEYAMFLILFYIFPIHFSIFSYNFYSQNPVHLILLTTYVTFIINLCNFMDGLDLYLSATLIMAIINLFLVSNSMDVSIAHLFYFLIASIFGFIIFNFPPAKLFMGDAGSLPLGFFIALMPLFLGENKLNSELSVIILIIPIFIIDGISTILFRLFKKENIFKAHRLHLYQRISLHYWNKLFTSISFSIANIIFVFFYLQLINRKIGHEFASIVSFLVFEIIYIFIYRYILKYNILNTQI